MNKWVALFRGINVGGNNLLPMKDLVALLEAIGCTEVRTYIQSGNVVFSSSASTAPQLAKSIGKSVLHSHGFEPVVQLLSVEALGNAVRRNPFSEAEENPKTLHVYFLAEKPKFVNQEALNDIKLESESYRLDENLFYLHAPDGIGRSRLAAKAEKLLGVDATARNWRTVRKLLELAEQS